MLTSPQTSLDAPPTSPQSRPKSGAAPPIEEPAARRSTACHCHCSVRSEAAGAWRPPLHAQRCNGANTCSRVRLSSRLPRVTSAAGELVLDAARAIHDRPLASRRAWRYDGLTVRFGTYFFLQATPGRSGSDVIEREMEQMVASEALGFDSVWLTEHHYADYGLSSAPSVLAATLAAAPSASALARRSMSCRSITRSGSPRKPPRSTS